MCRYLYFWVDVIHVLYVTACPLPQGEWTTTGRKGKKKSLDIDLIIAPGDTKSKGAPKGVRGTSKAGTYTWSTHVDGACVWHH